MMYQHICLSKLVIEHKDIVKNIKLYEGADSDTQCRTITAHHHLWYLDTTEVQNTRKS